MEVERVTQIATVSAINNHLGQTQLYVGADRTGKWVCVHIVAYSLLQQYVQGGIRMRESRDGPVTVIPLAVGKGPFNPTWDPTVIKAIRFQKENDSHQKTWKPTLIPKREDGLKLLFPPKS